MICKKFMRVMLLSALCYSLSLQGGELKTSFEVDFTKDKIAAVGTKRPVPRGRGLLTPAGLDASGKAGSAPFRYKLDSYLNPAEGAITINFSPRIVKSSKQVNSVLLETRQGRDWFGIGYNARPDGRIYLWTAVRGPKRAADSAEVLREVKLTSQSWYKVTVSWNRDKIALALNGKLLGKTERPFKLFYGQWLKVGGSNEKVVAHGIIKSVTIAAGDAKMPVTVKAAVQPGGRWQPYNVKDYGAKGDGVTDDAAAIQKCITVAERSIQYYYAERTYPEVIIPAGTYLLSKPLVISPKQSAKGMGLQLTGIGKVVLKQPDPTKDIIYVANGYRHIFENLSFEGGKRQIKFFTKNKDRSLLLIRNCNFSNSADYAVDDAMYGVHHSKIIPPYNISFNQAGLPELTPNDLSKLPDIYFTSTLMHITGSRFTNCMKVLRAHADWGIMDNCKIETNPQMRGAAIYARGVLKLKNIDGLARVTKGRQQRWIDNIMGSVILKNVNFDAEGDIGMCPVVNRRIYDNGGLYNVAVSIDSSSFKAAGSPGNSIVYCEEVPNWISIINSSEVSGKTIPAINFRPTVNKKYLQYVAFPELVKRDPELARIYGYMVSMPRVYDDVVGYKYKNNFAFNLHSNKNISVKLPKVLEQFVEPPLPKNIQAGFNPPPQTVSIAYMKKIFTKTLNVRDFGAQGNNSSDDTAALQKAFNAAGKAGDTELLLPNGIYRITKTLVLPKNIALRGLGNACLSGKDRVDTILQGKDVLNLSFRNIGFNRAKNALVIKTKATDASKILMDNCKFSEIRNLAINCSAGKGLANEPNKTEFLLGNAVFGRVRQLIASNAENARFTASWVTTDKTLENGAVFVNKGRLEISDLVGVPHMNHARWIDNYGKLIVNNVRFGGEGNRPNDLIDSRNNDNEIFVENSWFFCKGRSIIYCTKIPKIVALRNNCGIPADLQTMITVKNASKDDLVGRFFESCNISPTTIKTE
ncbi:MAG: glycoside hydrolase family 55 protein [Victivallaceae bacterium]|nr:glycoside hydrolase family 55 protein [Victivallaceae bacterium]